MSTAIRLIILSICAYLIFVILERHNFEFANMMGRSLSVPIFFVLLVLGYWIKEIKDKKKK